MKPYKTAFKISASDTLEERQWAERVRTEGDTDAFEKLFRTWYEPLHRFAYSYIGSVHGAEDVVQSVFLNIWVQREHWDPQGTIKSYLFTAVRNEALNVLRHLKVKTDAEHEIRSIYYELQHAQEEDERIRSVETEKKIRDSIDQLPPRCRQIFMLSRYSGLTYTEIAALLDISINTVTTQMGRALKSLRSHLSDHVHYMLLMSLLNRLF